jgi:hypothetical protein
MGKTKLALNGAAQFGARIFRPSSAHVGAAVKQVAAGKDV